MCLYVCVYVFVDFPFNEFQMRQTKETVTAVIMLIRISPGKNRETQTFPANTCVSNSQSFRGTSQFRKRHRPSLYFNYFSEVVIWHSFSSCWLCGQMIA